MRKRYYVSWPGNEMRFDTIKPSDDDHQLGRKVLELVEYKKLDWSKIWEKYDAWVPEAGYGPDDVKKKIIQLVNEELY